MKTKLIFIIIINILLSFTLSNLKAYDYFGIYYVPENTNILYFNVVNKDSIKKTCFLTSPDLGIKNLEAENFTFTNQDFFYSNYKSEKEIDIQTRMKARCYDGGAKIDGFVGKITIYKYDNETKAEFSKYNGIYYSIDKKDSVIVEQNDSLSLKITYIVKNNKESKIIYPNKSDSFISKNGFEFTFKLRNFIPWQIMFLSDGQQRFYYREL